MVFSVVLDDDSEEFGFFFVLYDGASDVDLDLLLLVFGVEDGVDGLGWIGDEVVHVEVADEVGEFRLCQAL